jgi:hypothetical protein
VKDAEGGSDEQRIRELLLILRRARRLLNTEGFDPSNERGTGLSLAAAVQYAESMLMYGDLISDDDRDLREFFDVCPLTLEEALSFIDASEGHLLRTGRSQT